MAPQKAIESDNVETRRRIIPRCFHRELSQMMSGFGDHRAPRAESIALMEEMVIEYLTVLVAKTCAVAHSNRRERPDVSDVKFVIRKDPKKLARVRYLLEMKAEIKKAISVVPTGDDAEKSGKLELKNQNS